jgi:hypothetical protein
MSRDVVRIVLDIDQQLSEPPSILASVEAPDQRGTVGV